MVVAQPSFSYTFSALVTTGAPELSYNYVVNIPNYKAAAICKAGDNHGLINQLYYPNYRELQVKEIFAESTAKVWRLRFRYRVQKNLIWVPAPNTPTIKIELPLTYQAAYYPKVPTARLQCFFSIYDNADPTMYKSEENYSG